MTDPNPMMEIIEKHSHRNEHSGCRIWEGAFGRNGVPMMEMLGNRIPAARLAYVLANGAIAPDAAVLQACENTRCVEPTHLVLGQPEESMALGFDATEDEIKEVVRMNEEGIKQSKIGEKMGFTPSKVSRILTAVKKGLVHV
jgi:hypothetical protein